MASLMQQKLAYQSRLGIIEGSLRWAIMNRLASVAPPLRPIVNRMRTMRIAFAQRVRASSTSTVQAPNWRTDSAHESENEAKPVEIAASSAQANVDLAYETAREPKWNTDLGRYELMVDEVYQSKQAAKTGVLKNLVAPYVLRPKAVAADPKSLPKVLHVIPNVFVGGSTQLIIDIVEHLSDVFQHEVVTSALWPAGQHVGLTAHHVTLSNMQTLQTLLSKMQPDLVHIHYWGLTDNPWYWAVMEQLEKFPMLPIVENVNTPVDPLISPRINRYVFVSKYVRTEFGSNLPGELTSIIYPGIDLDRFSHPYDGEDAENAVGMVYRLENDKLTIHAIDLFIEVVKRRPRTRVYIVGGGSFLEPWINKTAEQGVRQNFRFTGYVPYEELPEWYNRFSVFIAPVWKESFGQVAPFAMSKQIVVAGYRIGALPEIAGSDDFFGTGVEDTAKIIVDLLEDMERRSNIGRENQKRARSLFSVGAMVSAYERLYREVLAGRASSHLNSTPN
jgi:glycosyltransferase involved in cell wall biosynthesis